MTEPAVTQANPTDGLQDCDIIMKGGITSGIVYPGVVVELSKKYRLRQIGGASAGAIAATVAAAAETGRRKEGPEAGGAAFKKLGAIPSELGDKLSKLFQPTPRTAPAFDALMAWIKPGRTTAGKTADTTTAAKVAAVIAMIIRRAFGLFALATIIAILPAVVFDLVFIGVPGDSTQWGKFIVALLVWLPVALLVGLVIAAIARILAAKAAITDNGFGICDGHTARKSLNHPPLTDWMEAKLRDLAGTGERPVCFGDLWGEEATAAYVRAFTTGEPGSERVRLEEGEAARLTPSERAALRAKRLTDCLVMATDVCHRRPYRFPFDVALFFWCEKCLSQYFPDNVVAQMKANTGAVGPLDVGDNKANPRIIETNCPRHPGAPLYYMPLAPHIPVVIAARISLSFPALISAIPFQSVDFQRSPQNRDVVTVWFSDGGISSNFPMRFFDAAWPSRPTFGINLAPPDADDPEMVWRAKPGREGSTPRFRPVSTLPAFFSAILDTMQNWSDSVQMTMPGFRDRIVEVRQQANEGGMNLQMPKPVIDLLAARGTEAGKNLTTGDSSSPPFDFFTHRWIRHRVAMAGLDDLLRSMHNVWPAQKVFLDSVPDDFKSFRPGAKDDEATGRVMELAEELDRLGHPAAKKGSVPKPQPDLRLTPPL